MSHPSDVQPGRLQAERQRWARHLLEIPADAPPETVRALVLDRLVEDDLVPPPGWRAAAGAIVGQREAAMPADNAAFLDALESRCREEVETLAQSLFHLPPDERLRPWSELRERCSAFAPLRARLSAWAPAIGLPVPASSGEPRLDALVDHILQAFVLAPPAREASHWEFLERIRRERTSDRKGLLASDKDAIPWIHAVRRLRKSYPQVAQLAPEFVEAAAGDPRLLPWSLYCCQEWREQVKAAKASRSRKKRAAEPSRSGWGWAIPVVVVIAVNGARYLTEPSRSTSPSINFQAAPSHKLTPRELNTLLEDLRKREEQGDKSGEALRRLLGIREGDRAPTKQGPPGEQEGDQPKSQQARPTPDGRAAPARASPAKSP